LKIERHRADRADPFPRIFKKAINGRFDVPYNPRPIIALHSVINGMLLLPLALQAECGMDHGASIL